jgi:hypothetical protein
MSIAVTTRIGRDHSAAIHHQNPNPRSAVRLSSFRIAFAPGGGSEAIRDPKRLRLEERIVSFAQLHRRCCAVRWLASCAPIAFTSAAASAFSRTALQHRCAVCLIVLNSR